MRPVPKRIYRQMKRLVGPRVANVNHCRVLAEAWTARPHARSLAQLCFYGQGLRRRLLELPSLEEIMELNREAVQV